MSSVKAVMGRHGHVHLSSASVPGWRTYTCQAVRLLDTNRLILDSYVLDFFTEDLWSRLNPKWTAVLDTFGTGDLASFLQSGARLRQKTPWPLSLLAFRAACHALALCRTAVSSVEPLQHYLTQQVQAEDGTLTDPEHCMKLCDADSKSQHEHSTGSVECEVLTSAAHRDVSKGVVEAVSPVQQVAVLWGDSDSELSAAAGQHRLLQHVFRRHLKPKKQHEVARLALVAAEVAGRACEGVMVDVGSGQGHLSRLLAYGHSVRVVCLEAEDKFIDGARKFDEQLEKAVEKMTRKHTSLPPLPPGPRHAVCHLQPSMDPQAFTKVITGVWPDLKSRGQVCGLLGLHTCGDLAPTLLRLFTSMPACRALVSVGCCYMKLTTTSEEVDGAPGYPMSGFVRQLPGHTLSYESREVACHAVEMYTDRLSLGADNLKVHCYRACLEQVLVRHWPHHRHAGLRSVTNAHKMDFPTYAKQAVSRLKDVLLPEADLTSEETRYNLGRWQQVVVYYSLRLLLAPVVESVVLLDRLLFLYDNGLESILFPAFDPHLSPRNHVLVSVKPSNKL